MLYLLYPRSKITRTLQKPPLHCQSTETFPEMDPHYLSVSKGHNWVSGR